MATGLPIPWGGCLALSASLPFPCPLPRCLIPASARSQRPMDSLPLRAVVRPLPHALSSPRLLVPASRVYTPVGRLLPCGAGPLGPLPSRDRFVRLARVAPFPPPSLSPVPRPWPNPPGCLAAPSHPSSHVYTPPGCQQPRGAGPLDPHPSGDRFVRLARVAPLRPPTLSPVPSP